MSSNMERVAAMPDASLYVNRDGRRADDCVDSHGGGNLIKIPRSGGGTQRSLVAGILGYRAPFSPRDPAHVHHLRAAIVLFSAFLRTWRAVGRGIFPLFHLTIVLASLLVHVWMAARSVTVTGTTSRPLPTSSSTCRTGGTLSRIPRAGVLYWDDIDNGTLSIEFSMLLFCPPATSRAAPEIFMCHY